MLRERDIRESKQKEEPTARHSIKLQELTQKKEICAKSLVGSFYDQHFFKVF